MTTHSKLSPSSSKRWMNCPGSVKLIDSLPVVKEKPKRNTEEGTVAHTIHELCLNNFYNAHDYLGKKIKQGGFTFTVDEEMCEAVQESVDYIRERLNNHEYRHSELLVEIKYPLTMLGVEGLDGGTSDAILIFYNEDEYIVAIEIVDYKHGKGVSVEPEMNTQLLEYALGAVIHLDCDSATEIILTVAQPRAWHHQSTIRSFSLSYIELMKWQDEVLIPLARATLEEDAPLVPSDDACMFCQAKGNCPALWNSTQEAAMIDFKELSEPLTGLPSVKTLSSDQKLFIMNNSNIIKQFLESVEKRIKEEVEAGSKDYVDHFKLVRSRSNRKLNDIAFDEITSPLLDVLIEDEMYVKKEQVMGNIEKTLKKKLGKAKADEIMEKITYKEEGTIILTTIDDKRKEVESSASEDFKGLEN